MTSSSTSPVDSGKSISSVRSAGFSCPDAGLERQNPPLLQVQVRPLEEAQARPLSRPVFHVSPWLNASRDPGPAHWARNVRRRVRYRLAQNATWRLAWRSGRIHRRGGNGGVRPVVVDRAFVDIERAEHTHGASAAEGRGEAHHSTIQSTCFRVGAAVERHRRTNSAPDRESPRQMGVVSGAQAHRRQLG